MLISLLEAHPVVHPSYFPRSIVLSAHYPQYAIESGTGETYNQELEAPEVSFSSWHTQDLAILHVCLIDGFWVTNRIEFFKSDQSLKVKILDCAVIEIPDYHQGILPLNLDSRKFLWESLPTNSVKRIHA